MGIIDDLREQAIQKQSEQQEDTILKEKLAHNYQILILPKMQQLFSYFKELLDYLTVIEAPICIPHYSNRYRKLGKLYQLDYRLSTDKHGGIANYEKLTEITLRFNCQGQEEGEFTHSAESKFDAEQEKEFLSLHKIPFTYDRYLGNSEGGALTFHISRKIPAIFKFSIDYENSRIILTIHNHEDFEQRTQFINPEQINEAYMDKLARYILRKDTEFIQMDIDESHKEKIRQQVEAQKKAHAEELRAAHLREEYEQKAAEAKKVKNRVKSFFNKK